MQFKKSQRDRILKVMNKFENMGFVNAFKKFLDAIYPFKTGEDFSLCKMLLKIFPFTLVMISLAGPYLMVLFAFYYNFTIPIKILSILSSIFFLISLLGVYGKGMVCCLTHPCNWFFLMLSCDVLTIVCEGAIFYLRSKMDEEYSYDMYGIGGICGNSIFTFIFFIQHFRVYKKINVVFTAMILMELDYIYYGSHQILDCPV